jgi:hypothetical protein
MSVTVVFHDLDQRFQALHDALLALRTTVLEDCPLPGDHVLVERLGDGVDDVLGYVDEALAAMRRSQPDACQPVAWERVCQTLVTCQSGYNHAARSFWFRLATYEQIADLLRLGRERGGEWRPWSSSVRQGLDCCQQPFFEVNEALFRGWREVADRH